MRSKTYSIDVKPVRMTEHSFDEDMCLNKKQQDKITYNLSLLRDHGEEPPFSGPLVLDVVFFVKKPKLIKDRTSFPTGHPNPVQMIEYLIECIQRTNAIWKDKIQIIEVHFCKKYDQRSHIQLRISEHK